MSKAQSDTTETAQSVKEKTNLFKRIKTSWPNPYPNPTRAGVYSILVPGAGQIYNKRYWKAPLVWGAVGAGFAYLNWNIDRENCYQKALEEILANGQPVVAECNSVTFRTSDSAKRARDQHNKWKQLSYVAIVGVWALQALEAYTDAHLKGFDIDDNLSYQISLDPNISSYSGIGLSLTLRIP